MLQYTKAKGIGGADWLGLVTRDCPNVIVPTAASPIARNPGDAWTWSVYAQVTAGLAYDFLLRQLIMSTGLGASITANGILTFTRQEQIEIATFIQQAYTVIAEAQLTESVLAVMASNIDGVTTCMLYSTTTRDVPLFPVVIPDNTYIALRATLDTATVRKYSRFYLSGYDLSTLSFADYVAYTKAFEEGSVSCYAGVYPLGSNVSVISGTSALTFGSYSTIDASLSNDCLVTFGVCIPTLGITASSVQLDVAVGAAGSEVVQARYALATAAYLGSCQVRFPLPFIAYKGERLSVRLLEDNGSSQEYRVGLSGIKLL